MLNIEKQESMGRMDTMKITGFGGNELSELKSMEHKEAGKKLLDMIDSRNDGIATFWARGKGIYGIWFDNEAAYINVGRSAD